MLQKLRSRHPIDLPAGAWERKRGILAVLGSIAVLFVAIPLLLSPLVTLSASVVRAVLLVGAGMGALVLALAVGAMRGKFGWDR